MAGQVAGPVAASEEEVAALETAFINFVRAYAQQRNLGVRMYGKRKGEVFSHRQPWSLGIELAVSAPALWAEVWTVTQTGHRDRLEWPGSSAVTPRELTVALQFVRAVWKEGSGL